jgi:DNA-nicking Smr family endonuclease
MKFPEEISPADKPNERQLRITQAELRDSVNALPVLDLHGFTEEDAASEAERFIADQFYAGVPCCRIEHGKGKGVVERAVKEKILEFTKKRQIELSFPSAIFPGGAIVIIFTPAEE